MYTLYKWTRLTNYHKKAGREKKGKPHAKGLWKSFKSPIYSIGFTDVISQVNLHILIRELSSKSHFVAARFDGMHYSTGTYSAGWSERLQGISIQYHVDCVLKVSQYLPHRTM